MFGLNFNKIKETYIDYSKKPESIKMIEYIESQLTPDQLKKLELSGFGKSFSFKDRMMVNYGHMYPIFLLEDSKQKIKKIIDGYSHLFDKGLEFYMNGELVRQFGDLFVFHKPSYKKTFLIN